MSAYALSACSTADHPRSFFEERDILCTLFHYQMDGEIFADDLYESITPAAFFEKIMAGSEPTTSQPAAGEYAATWEPHLQAGEDILHVSLSSGISGAYNSACIARDQLTAAYPDRRIIVIDSLAASAGYGMLLEYLADLRDAGQGIEEVAAWAEEHKLELNSWFYVSDLECLKRGGRVSKTSALIATALKICPVLDIDAAGHLIPRAKIRTKKKAMAELARICAERIEDGASYQGRCCISHSDCREDAEEVARLVSERIPTLSGKIGIYNIGTVIGSHTGPGTVALFFMGEPRRA
ncbi:DegV family protein [Collinsella vaginalis]|uniref:DegV family protein n=1 Tax=Collinsella vaginalis TaxID=1870987 RepID=UPI000A26A9AB|nr:DegV family protein [Collinsella vaginalis]